MQRKGCSRHTPSGGQASCRCGSCGHRPGPADSRPAKIKMLMKSNTITNQDIPTSLGTPPAHLVYEAKHPSPLGKMPNWYSHPGLEMGVSSAGLSDHNKSLCHLPRLDPTFGHSRPPSCMSSGYGRPQPDLSPRHRGGHCRRSPGSKSHWHTCKTDYSCPPAITMSTM